MKRKKNAIKKEQISTMSTYKKFKKKKQKTISIKYLIIFLPYFSMRK